MCACTLTPTWDYVLLYVVIFPSCAVQHISPDCFPKDDDADLRTAKPEEESTFTGRACSKTHSD